MICECGHDESEHNKLGCMNVAVNDIYCTCMNDPHHFDVLRLTQRAEAAEARATELAAQLATAQAERDAAIVKIKVLFNVAHDAVGHVAAANYPERESLAHKWIDDEYERKP